LVDKTFYECIMRHLQLFHTIILVLLLPMATTAAAIPIHDSGAELRQTVIALDRARNRAAEDLNQKQQNAPLSDQEQRDYEKFITFLSAKIDKYCQQLLTEGGETAAADLPCPDGGQALFAPQIERTATSAEQVVDLEKILAESLGQFDESLLKEDERIAARQPRGRETGYGQGQGSSANGEFGGTGASSEQDSGDNSPSGAGTMQGQDAEDNGTTGPGAGTEMSGSTTGSGDRTGAVPGKEVGTSQGRGSEQSAETASQTGQQEIETGYDDIVARQLREAAEKETDPELKKKLWEEYRKYKEGVQ
jgi:hypothetical protein